MEYFCGMAEATKAGACDSEPLRRCLERNNNDRSKCEREWAEFRAACARGLQCDSTLIIGE